MYSSINTVINVGLEPVLVRVEADISDGMPSFEMVGFLASEVRESKERVKTALKNSGFKLPPKKITVSMTPADLRKSGNGCDLPIAASILAAMGIIDDRLLRQMVLVGEIGLNGEILPVSGVLNASILVTRENMDGVIVPTNNANEAAIIDEVKVYDPLSIRDFVRLCQNELEDEPFKPNKTNNWNTNYTNDFSQVYGQPLVKRACEIAISGMHNLLMIGPPGSGKSMIAKRIPTIMPELERDEKLELSQIYSISGILDEEHIIKNERPFRSPHHSITPHSLIGGGRIPKPGEISLAHRGVLYLDELPEFNKLAIEALREPLEDKKINISRVEASYSYPADFELVCSMNPCPCGYFPDVNRCTCSGAQIQAYINKISQAMLDRIDITVETLPMGYTDLVGVTQNETSAEIRNRVKKVYEIQRERFEGSSINFNSQMNNDEVWKYCLMDEESKRIMPVKYSEYSLTPRTYIKLLKTARTIADMDESEIIMWKHLQEALFYRSPDKKYWRRF